MLQTSKTFRIFVSSTFSDLKEERNALQKHVFPKLRDLCMQHGCRFQAIDLRWGVSEEASHDQQTMKICLEEIRRCQRVSARPNFIVLLGDRYGWCPLPYEIPADEFEAILQNVSHADEKELLTHWYTRDDNAVPPVYDLQPREGEFTDSAKWKSVEHRLRSILLATIQNLPLTLDERLKYEASVTEQKIHDGVLSVEGIESHVFCYFRKIDNLPKDRQAQDFVDLTSDNIFDQDAWDRQEALKTRLKTRLPADHIYEYHTSWPYQPSEESLQRLCTRVEHDLKHIIEEEIRGIEQIPELQQEIKSHLDFAREHAEHFTGREDILTRIKDYLTSNTRQPLIIHGRSGSGKTAVLAKAALESATNHDNAIMITRFIGATPASTQIRSLLGDICRQIAETYDDIRPISTNYQVLIQDFPQRLALATAQHPIVLFVDALDQLSPTDNALALMWLPRPLPENVKLIVSVLDEPGKTAHCLQTARGIFPSKIFVPLTDLSPDHGEELLDKWLAEANRALQPHQREEILSKFIQTGLPLYLKIAFEETRCWKSYTNRDTTVLTPGVPDLIHALLERLSLPRNHGEMFVSRVLGYLAAARNGLTEDELLDILSQDDEYFAYFLTQTHHDLPTHSDNEHRLPVVLWSRLYYDVQPYLTRRNADQTVLLSFYHRQLAQVVTQRYLSKKPKYIKFHQALADYFQEQSLGPRKVAELPWQLTELGSWARLKTVLSNLPFLNAAWDLDGHEVMEYWSNVTRNLGCRVDEAYAAHWSEALLQGT